MTNEEQRVVEAARRAVTAGRAWCDARDASSALQGNGLRMHIAMGLAEHRAAAENAEAEIALMDAVDALNVARDALGR